MDTTETKRSRAASEFALMLSDLGHQAVFSQKCFALVRILSDFQQDVLAPRGFAFAFGLFGFVVWFQVLVLVDGLLVSGSLFTDDFGILVLRGI